MPPNRSDGRAVLDIVKAEPCGWPTASLDDACARRGWTMQGRDEGTSTRSNKETGDRNDELWPVTISRRGLREVKERDGQRSSRRIRKLMTHIAFEASLLIRSNARISMAARR
jgi:hypothetical protein